MIQELDTPKIKRDFPILNRKINGHTLIYLDNAATSQKPIQVMDTISDYYENHNANIHRGVHTLSEEASELYETARKKVSKFINASVPDEVIFTAGTTNSINKVALSWGMQNIKEKDAILLTDFEHHSNLIPWQIVAQKKKAKLFFVETNTEGEFSILDFKDKVLEIKKAGYRIKLVSITHSSNLLGNILPLREIIQVAHAEKALVNVDGAQAVPHFKVDMQKLGCDFYSFSGHKMLGPMGIGVLWAEKKILENLDPFEFGGGMINEVQYHKSSWAEVPEKFEAGTPNVEGAVGLASAIDYLEDIGMENIFAHEQELTKYLLSKLVHDSDIQVVGSKDPEQKTGLVSFTVKGIHSHDLATILDADGVAIRSGHHCVMAYHKKHHLPATSRVSFYLYNSFEDVDKLILSIQRAKKIL